MTSDGKAGFSQLAGRRSHFGRKGKSRSPLLENTTTLPVLWNVVANRASSGGNRIAMTERSN
jgi:hypothetical protein